MRNKDRALDSLMRDSAFIRFIIAQGISGLGDSFRFIAVTMLLVEKTGSGISASLGMMFSIIPSLILSPFAGTIGDILPEKPLMALIDIIRGAVILLFIYSSDVNLIFILIIIVSALETVYSPLSRKLVLRVAGKDRVLNANSILTGLSGISYLLGPLLAGFLTEGYGTAPALIVSAITFVISSFFIITIRTGRYTALSGVGHRATFGEELAKGFSYVKGSRPVLEIVFTMIITAFCTISMNMAFYPFAFDVLKLDSKGWSLLISVYYGTNLLAMFISFSIEDRLRKFPWGTIYAGLALTALIWALYGFTVNFGLILILQFIEGTILAVCSIVLTTLLQTTAKKGFIARVAGFGDITASAGKLASLAFTYCVILLESYRSVFIINAIILLGFVILRLMSHRGRFLFDSNWQ